MKHINNTFPNTSSILISIKFKLTNLLKIIFFNKTDKNYNRKKKLAC